MLRSSEISMRAKSWDGPRVIGSIRPWSRGHGRGRGDGGSRASGCGITRSGGVKTPGRCIKGSSHARECAGV